MEVGTSVEKALSSEMSGNIVDCARSGVNVQALCLHGPILGTQNGIH